MPPFLLWYLSISLLGWLTFPLAYRLLPGLPDRGYAFSRTLGWLLWGYLFWLLASLGVLDNNLGGLIFALLAVAVLSVWAWRGLGPGEISVWLRSRRGMVLVVELLFLAAFAGLTFVRAANPNIEATEKPMELAFINAILRSPEFPPHDPWLSGYAISYYYFGYVLVSLLAKLTGVPAGISFNLGIALVFALSALGAYGLVYNLLAARQIKDEGGRMKDEKKDSSFILPPSSFLPLLGPLFVLLVSNLEGFLEVLHARGLFWRLDPASGSWVSSFWKWLDIKDLNLPPAEPFSWIPSRFLWWWRASRVVQDYDLLGNPIEIIDEFPVFSYLLSDLHPHVLAMPFAFLAMALALNLFLGGGGGRFDSFHRRVGPRLLLGISLAFALVGLVLLWAGVSGLSFRLGLLGLVGFLVGGFVFVRAQPALGGGLAAGEGQGSAARPRVEVGMPFYLSAPTFLLAAVVLGGLAFLNTWDFPVYVALFAAAYALGRMKDEGGRMKDEGDEAVQPLHPSSFILPLFRNFLALALTIGVAGILFYLPFYFGFSSQASGFLPNLVNPTRGAQLWIMFGSLLLPIGAYLIYLWRSWRPVGELSRGFVVALGILMALWILALLFGLGITFLPNLGGLYMSKIGAPDRLTLLRAALQLRLISPGAWITLSLLLGAILGLLIRGIGDMMSRGAGVQESRGAGEQGSGDKIRRSGEEAVESPIPNLESTNPPIYQSTSLPVYQFTNLPHLFTLLLILLGTLLVLGPEFFYLLDLFGTRMNTIFKFYYQAWLLWGVAAAFGVAVLLQDLRRVPSFLFTLALALLLGMGLTYTVLGVWQKTQGFRPEPGLTLDGTAYLERANPDEMAAVRWLRAAPPGVVAEAVGGSYSGYARISMLSGLPTVLGWDFHEVQWRGTGELTGVRKEDVQRLYCARSWDLAQSLIDQYDIRYIYVGSLERMTYTPGQNACAAGLNQALFDRYLTQAFHQGDVTIYEVR